jgi:hypothetical protein
MNEQNKVSNNFDIEPALATQLDKKFLAYFIEFIDRGILILVHKTI